MKKHEIELLPSPQEVSRAPARQIELDQLVQQKVAEILAARDEFVFEPFFRSRQIAFELKRLQTVPEQRKWQVFYQQHGCLRCRTAERIHVGNGLCGRCYPWVHRVLKEIIREAMNEPTTIIARPRERLAARI